MLGAIAGDVIGSVHEFHSTKSEDFSLFVAGSRFTDDTVLAVAVALVGVAAGLSTPIVAATAGIVASVLVPVVYRIWSTGKEAGKDT